MKANQNNLVEGLHGNPDTLTRTYDVHRDALRDLVVAASTAADWLARSTRIDDREQSDDLRDAIALCLERFNVASHLNNSASDAATP